MDEEHAKGGRRLADKNTSLSSVAGLTSLSSRVPTMNEHGFSVPTEKEIQQYLQAALERKERAQVKADMEKSTEELVRGMPFVDWLGAMSGLGVLSWLVWLIGIGNPFEPPPENHWAREGWPILMLLMLLCPITFPLTLYLASRERKQRLRRAMILFKSRVATITDSLDQQPDLLKDIDAAEHSNFILAAADETMELSDFKRWWLLTHDKTLSTCERVRQLEELLAAPSRRRTT